MNSLGVEGKLINTKKITFELKCNLIYILHKNIVYQFFNLITDFDII